MSAPATVVLPEPVVGRPWLRPDWWPAIDAATAAFEPPFGIVHLGLLATNAADLERRADGVPLRLASKSVRVRALQDAVLARDGWHGLLAFTLPEAIHLVRHGATDVVVAYPTADRAALAVLASDEQLVSAITLMVDETEQLDLVEAAAGSRQAAAIRVAIELDVAYRSRVLGHVGVRRSPVRTPRQAARLAAAIVARPAFSLVGMMAYEAQIAGLGDAGLGKAALRAVQRASIRELTGRRDAAVAAVQAIAPLEFVNGGGSGSVESTRADAGVTEIAAGSGLIGPHLFDHYRRFRPAPAAAFALPVVRKPARHIATVQGGGWIASGPPGDDRLPKVVHPRGLAMLPREGAGEVQTPLTGRAAVRLHPGDRVWLRHTKAGELAEHLTTYLLLTGSAEAGMRVVAQAATYRGEGMVFL